jgi:uncharacterized membrane protein
MEKPEDRGQGSSPPEKPKTSTGLDENVAGLLCYVGWWVSGIVFLLLEPNNKFIRFHALQSIIVFGIITVAGAILETLPFIWFIGTIVWLIGVALWIVLMVKAYQGAKYKLWFAGDIAEKAVGGQPPKQQ